MRRRHLILAGAAATLAGATVACSDATSSRQSLSSASLRSAFASVPVGYGDLTSSYVGSAAATAGDTSHFIGCDGRGPGMGAGDMMGGGLDNAFLGGVGIGDGRGGHGPFGGGLPCAGSFSSATGRVACDPVTLRNGLTVTRSASYADAAGQLQQAFDSTTTDVVNLRTSVTGTLTFTGDGHGDDDSTAHADSGSRDSGEPDGGGRDGGRGGRGGPGGLHLLGDTAHIVSATTTVNDASDRTVSGLAQGSTQRTVSGTSAGAETTTGTSSRGDFTATRSVADTASGLVVPVQAGMPTYPTAGTVVRVMQATLTYTGQSPVTLSRREVVTYDGSATAHVVITENGTTRNCTRALPRGELSCS